MECTLLKGKLEDETSQSKITEKSMKCTTLRDHCVYNIWYMIPSDEAVYHVFTGSHNNISIKDTLCTTSLALLCLASGNMEYLYSVASSSFSMGHTIMNIQFIISYS